MDRLTLYEILMMLAVKDAHKEVRIWADIRLVAVELADGREILIPEWPQKWFTPYFCCRFSPWDREI